MVCLIFSFYSLPIQSKQKRSYHAIKKFELENPCPANGRYKGSCEGYFIDHVKPFACGGLDIPKNMQWQTAKVERAKDKWERVGC